MRTVIGSEPAATVMEILPPMSSSDIATKDDTEHIAGVLRGEMIEFRSEPRSEMHREFGALRADSASCAAFSGRRRGTRSSPSWPQPSRSG
jgi:hypothetical protein